MVDKYVIRIYKKTISGVATQGEYLFGPYTLEKYERKCVEFSKDPAVEDWEGIYLNPPDTSAKDALG